MCLRRCVHTQTRGDQKSAEYAGALTERYEAGGVIVKKCNGCSRPGIAGRPHQLRKVGGKVPVCGFYNGPICLPPFSL